MAQASPGKAGIHFTSLLLVVLAAGSGLALHQLAAPAAAGTLADARAALGAGPEAALRRALDGGILAWLAIPTLGPLLVAVLLQLVAPRGRDTASAAQRDTASEAPALAPERAKAPAVAPERAKAPAAEPAIPGAEALRLLAALQEEARLVDFVREDLDGYSDAQVGAAVRGIHASLRKAVDQRLALHPILAGEDGDAVEVPAGFDPARIRVIGDPRGEPPWRGVLRHGGWKASDLRLPVPTPGSDATILAPAEVEVGGG